VFERLGPRAAIADAWWPFGPAARLPAYKLYFDIAPEGNTSFASIPIALRDAVVEGVIDRPMRVLAPAFGAGAVAGYAVLRPDPGIVAV